MNARWAAFLKLLTSPPIVTDLAKGTTLDPSRSPIAVAISEGRVQRCCIAPARIHFLCGLNAFIVRSRTSCIAFGLGTP